MSSLASSLPAELLHIIFELLGQPAVLAAAAVSRTWRETAVREHSYYRAWTFLFPPGRHSYHAQPPRHPRDSDLASFAQVVQDAELRQYALSLSVRIQKDHLWDAADQAFEDGLDNADELGDLADEKQAQDWLFIADAVVPVLRRAVPRLVRLNILVDPEFASLIVSAFSVPAPLLQVLYLGVWEWEDVDMDDPTELPANLFAGSASFLRDVYLYGFRTYTPQPCFATVSALNIQTTYISDHLAAVVSAFPRLRQLGLHDLQRLTEDPIDGDEATFLQRLDTLHIGDNVECTTLVPLLSAILHIPDIEVVSHLRAETLSPLFGVPVPHELRLFEYAPDDGHVLRERYFSQLRLHLESSTSVRSLDAMMKYDLVFRVLVQSAAAHTLVKVTIDDRLIRSLMEACPAMPLLEDLCIIVIAWSLPIPDEMRHATVEHDCACPPTTFAAVNSRPPDDAVSIYCPRLSTITLYAVCPDAAVPTDVLLALSRAFDGPRLELELANGLSLSDADSPEAASAFRSVHLASNEFRASPSTKRAATLLREAARLGARVHDRSCRHS